MSNPTTPRAWLGLLLDPLTTDDALRAAGGALACDDAARYAVALARCGPGRAPAVAAWHSHVASCGRDHGTLDLPEPQPSMLASDALLRELHQPVLMASVVGTWTCQQALDVAVAAHLLNGRSFVSRDLVLAHTATCARHGQVVTLLDALEPILDHLARLDAP